MNGYYPNVTVGSILGLGLGAWYLCPQKKKRLPSRKKKLKSDLDINELATEVLFRLRKLAERGKTPYYQVDPDIAESAVSDVMMEVLNNYDPSKGHSPISFAMSRLPKRIIDRHRAVYGRKAGIKYEKLRKTISGDDPWQGKEGSPFECLSTPEEQVDINLLYEEIIVRLRSFYPEMEERLLEILEQRRKGYTLKEIGNNLGISESLVCQLLKQTRPHVEEVLKNQSKAKVEPLLRRK